MANWYDFIPGVNSIQDAASGDWTGALKHGAADLFTGGLYSPLSAGYEHFFKEPANNAKAAYDQAIGQSQASGQQIRDFLMGQQEKALGFYQPMQQLFNQTYGSGIQAPQIPRATGAR